MAPASRILSFAAALVMLAGCASKPAQTTAAPADSPESAEPATQHWSMATEADVAAQLDRKFDEAAKGYVKLLKDGKLMFCKRYRVIGSNIPTIQCITEAQLRNQVESNDQYRQRLRDTVGKCTLSVGCQAGN